MHVLTALESRQIAELRERDEFFWLDLTAPSEADIDLLGRLFSFHPLALEDTRRFDQRPKIDEYGDHVLLVFYGARADEQGEPTPVEVHVFISGGYVVTVHQDPCEMFSGVRDRLSERTKGSEEFIVYRILDVLTDSFFPVLGSVDDEIDELEDAVVTHADENQLQRIFHLKRQLVTFRKIVTPQRDLLARAIDQISALPGFEADARDYFRDVYDHMIRISDLIDSYRDLLTGALDVYLSTVSNRLNSVMERLTIVATIFLPLSVVTGFFGQNFKWMTDRIDTLWAFMVFGVGGLLIACFLLLAWFRRSGYI